MILLIFSLLYLCLVFALKSFVFLKRTGINPITFDRKDDAHGFMGRIFGMVSIATVMATLIYALNKSWYAYLLPFWYLENIYLYSLGWFFLIGSLFFIMIAQNQMSDSWRIGIDHKEKTKLIQHGLFAYSRNPIYLGIMLTNLGLFFVIPNAIIFMTTIVSTISMHTQVRLEEDFLSEEFGEQYVAYKQKVHRWF